MRFRPIPAQEPNDGGKAAFQLKCKMAWHDQLIMLDNVNTVHELELSWCAIGAEAGWSMPLSKVIQSIKEICVHCFGWHSIDIQEF